MCGIAIAYNFNRNIDREAFISALEKLKNRGPDIQQTYIDSNIAAGHTRLKILDLSDDANQPMHSNSSFITFNGEIYNYQDIKKELLTSGINFNTSSDTEVLLYGFEQWGITGLLERIDGMFAFAIYSKKQNKIFIARDRFGKKPLYYYNQSNHFVAASQLSFINTYLRKEGVSLSPNYNSIQHYFAELSMPQPYTIWENVFQLNPGEFAVLDCENNMLAFQKYYHFEPKEPISISFSEALEKANYLIEQAVQKRLLADVPVGTLLSGGVDSSLVSYFANTLSDGQITAYTVDFPHEYFSEKEMAVSFASKNNINHVVKTLKARDVISNIEKLIDIYDEPFGDSSALATYFVANAIKGESKVVLTGDGGDEIFGGYFNYLYSYLCEKNASRINNNIINKLFTVPASKVLSRINSKHINYGILIDWREKSIIDKTYRHMGFVNDNVDLFDHRKFSDTFNEEYTNSIIEQSHIKDETTKIMHASLKLRLLNDYLVKVDRAFMGVGIETRSPFLDQELIEFVFSLPRNILFTQNESKGLLKQILLNNTGTNLKKKRKMGFSLPIGSWFRNELHDQVLETINSEAVKGSGLFNNNYINKTIAEHMSGKFDHTNKIYLLYYFGLWNMKNKAI